MINYEPIIREGFLSDSVFTNQYLKPDTFAISLGLDDKINELKTIDALKDSSDFLSSLHSTNISGVVLNKSHLESELWKGAIGLKPHSFKFSYILNILTDKLLPKLQYFSDYINLTFTKSITSEFIFNNFPQISKTIRENPEISLIVKDKHRSMISELSDDEQTVLYIIASSSAYLDILSDYLNKETERIDITVDNSINHPIRKLTKHDDHKLTKLASDFYIPANYVTADVLNARGLKIKPPSGLRWANLYKVGPKGATYIGESSEPDEGMLKYLCKNPLFKETIDLIVEGISMNKEVLMDIDLRIKYAIDNPTSMIGLLEDIKLNESINGYLSGTIDTRFSSGRNTGDIRKAKVTNILNRYKEILAKYPILNKTIAETTLSKYVGKYYEEAVNYSNPYTLHQLRYSSYSLGCKLSDSNYKPDMPSLYNSFDKYNDDSTILSIDPVYLNHYNNVTANYYEINSFLEDGIKPSTFIL